MSQPSLNPDQRDFHCSHCHGRIIIPRDLPPTTAPCPHCGQETTSPAQEFADPQPFIPESEPVTEDVASPVSEIEEPVPVLRRPRMHPSAPVVKAPVTPEPAILTAVAEPALPNHQAPEVNLVRPAPAVQTGPKKPSMLIPLLVTICLLAVLAGAYLYYIRKMNKEAAIASKAVEIPVNVPEKIKPDDWQAEAYKVLGGFLAAKTPKEKARYTLEGESALREMEDFYGEGEIDDSDTPLQNFATGGLQSIDSERGIYLLVYDLPAQFGIKDFFRPLAPMEVEYGVQEPSILLTAFARTSNFMLEPIRASAYFKRTNEGLKMDWHVFVQTRYRTLRSFLDSPEPGRSTVFRVLVLEDVAVKGKQTPGTRVYRVTDPTFTNDSVRVSVPVDSEIGKSLSVINWRDIEGAKPQLRTATVELEWSAGDNPEVQIKKFICYEFLGLGGQADSGKK
jgi:hypothetical protein